MPSPSLPTQRIDVVGLHEAVRTGPDRERHGLTSGEVLLPRDRHPKATKRSIAELGLRTGLDEAATSGSRQEEETTSEPAMADYISRRSP